jgi:hypothetical protein
VRRRDADDLVLEVRRLIGELLVEFAVAHHLSVVFERLGDLLLGGGRRHRAVLRDLVNAIESVASMIARAKASPNESPKEAATELTPEASLTCSSETGRGCSC